MNGDLILECIGALVIVVVIVVVALAATGMIGISVENTETGKVRRWGKKK